MNKLRKLVVFIRAAYFRYKNTNAEQLAGSLSFVSILALVPLLTIIFIVLASNPELTAISKLFREYLVNELLPKTGGEVIVKHVFNFSKNASTLSSVGIAFLIITVLMLLNRIESALNQICSVTTTRKVFERVINYWVVISLGPIVVGLIIYLIYQSTYVAYSTLGAVNQFLGVFIGKAISLIMMIALLCFIYSAMPNKNIDIRDSLSGAVFTAVSISLLQKVFEFYLSNFSSYTVIYGAFATLPIFLIWIYLCWEAFLIGACLVAYFDDKRRGISVDSRWHKSLDSPTINSAINLLQIMALLWQNFNSPNNEVTRALSIKNIANTIGLSVIESENILNYLEKCQWVINDKSTKAKSSWVIAINPKNINAEQLQKVLFAQNELRMGMRVDEVIAKIYQAQNLNEVFEKFSLCR